MSSHNFMQSKPVVKNSVMIVLCILLLLVLVPAVQAAGATADELQAAPTNPEFLKYLNEKSYNSQMPTGTHRHGLIPSPIYRPEIKDVQMFGPDTGDRSSEYPSLYDLRVTGDMSPVKDQNPWGTCWAFATYASLESTLMPATPTPNFSEKNLVNLAGFDNTYDDGGDMEMSTAYLVRWNGPVNSATDPYPKGSWASSNTYPPVKHVQNVVYFPARSNRTDTDNIKGALTRWGAIFTSMHWDETLFFNESHSSYYQPASHPDADGGHAVAIAGWNDAYEATNFTDTPPGPGAWIVKNSWGTGWGEDGYFYVSYYDKLIGSAIADGDHWTTAAFLGESTSNYDTIYSYDKLGEVQDYSYVTTKTGSFANVFTTNSSETIKAVGFYTTDLNVPYNISIYKNPTSGPVGGTSAATFSGTLPYMGYNTVIIPSDQVVAVTTGDKFSVVVQVANPTNTKYIPIEENRDGYASGVVSVSGQGYLLGSSGWNDLKTIPEMDNSHVCVKAYTSSAGFLPVASFSGTPTSGIAPLTVAFTDSSTNTPTSWNWSFGDGSTSTLQNPSHIFTSVNNYTVILTATNSAGSNTITRTGYITVRSSSGEPVANFSGTPTSGNAPLTVTFTDSSTNSPTSWNWTFGDGTTSTSKNPVHTYLVSGTYTVLLNATNAAGSNIKMDTDYITVSSGSETYVFTTKWGTDGTGNGQFKSPDGIDVDSSGNAYVADFYNDRIQKFNSAGTFITKWGTSGTGNGQFKYPSGVATDSSDHVYVADGTYEGSGNHRIQKFDSDGTFLLKWGSYGSGDGQFNSTTNVAVDPSDYVYVADRGNNRIQKFSSDGTFLLKWGSIGSGDGHFVYPAAIAVDSSGNVFVADTDNHRIQKFSSDGIFIAKWGSYGSGDGQFKYPRGIAVDSSGNVFVSDRYNHRVQKFSSAGTFLTTWGTEGTGDGQFEYPYGVTVSNSGSVYVADTENNRIQKFAPASAYPPVANFAGTPTSGAAPLAVAFTDSSTGSPASWSWNFGDGITSTVKNPSHTYTSAGTYTVALNATNSAGSNTITRTGYITVTSPISSSTVGVLRDGEFYLASRNSDGGGTVNSFSFGSNNDLPATGDWTGQGKDIVGVFRDGEFYLASSNSEGGGTVNEFSFGAANDKPITGKWTNSQSYDTVGVFRQGRFYLASKNSEGGGEVAAFSFGAANDIPIRGDWTGQGYDTVGVFRQGMFYLASSNSDGGGTVTAFNFGAATDIPVVWHHDGKDSVGVFRSGTFYLKNDNSAGNADNVFSFGAAGDTPIDGKWI